LGALERGGVRRASQEVMEGTKMSWRTDECEGVGVERWAGVLMA
jgi:hypothetical protein